jgi:hypothetical protein
MVAPISSLANMEWQLYGGMNTNLNAPSVTNNFRGAVAMNPYLYSSATPYMYPSIYPTTNQNYTNSYNSQANTSTTDQTGLAQINNSNSNAVDILADYYKKGLAPSEGLAGAAISGAAFGLISNPRFIAHPINSIKGISDVKEMFKGVKTEGSALNKLWKSNDGVMREAYFQMQKASSRANSKLGLFRKRYSEAEYNQLKTIMEKALKTGKIEEIAKASETLKSAYATDGYIPSLWKKMKNVLGFTTETKDFASRIGDKATIAEGTKELLKSSKKMSFLKTLKHCGGIKSGLFFMGIELFSNFEKIKTAYGKDSKTGNEQLGQSLIKGAGSTLGWFAGEAAGTWAMTTLGAKIGTMFGPGVGTAIGGLVGLIGGSIGMCLAGKATNAIVGQDVADTVTANNLKASTEGKTELLKYALEKVQAGEKVDPTTLQAAQSVAYELNIAS